MKRKILLNSYLTSIILNLTLLLILSFILDYSPIQIKKDDVDVQFVSIPKSIAFQRRSVSIGEQIDQASISGTGHDQANAKYLTTTTYRAIIRELAPKSQDPNFLDSLNDFDLSNPSSLKGIYRYNNNNASIGRSNNQARGTSKGLGSSKSQGGQIGENINPDEPLASISGSDDSLIGFYNMSLIKYEANSDSVGTDALYQLAGAMNRWTKLKTQVIRKPMRLDDPKLINVPLVYITSHRPFAFSERERQNLCRFFDNGGFLIFSNTADSKTQKLEVANSIGFELWKILGEPAHNLSEIDENHLIYKSFFNIQKSSLPEILEISINDRIIAIYEDTGYGNAWISNKSGKQEPYMEMGVNIIAYALTTNPNISRKR